MLSLSNLSVGYGSRTLIDNASIGMASGRLVALIGRNGAGKSTLLHVLAGMGKPLSGRVMIDGVDISAMAPQQLARRVSFVNTERIRIANLRCHDVVGLGRAPYTDWVGRLSKDDDDIVMRSLQQVGMEDYALRTMDKMSDGECQRVMIARALAQSTPVMLLDEPTSFLDMPNRYEMCLLLSRLAHEEQKTIVFSTHELDIALSICDDVALIDSPNLVYGTAEEIAGGTAIERLFRSPNVRFNATERRVEITNKANG